MCTVTIFSNEINDFVLTSNRDEAPNRNALAPDFYTINDVELLLPKDEKSGGSWVGTSSQNRVLCLLNGGFENHEKQKQYRHSRGVVLRDLLVANTIVDVIKKYDLTNIEPFTLVIADWNLDLKFYELVWDGLAKHFKELPLEPKIWSSSTLYSEEKKQLRLDWFNHFNAENELEANSVLEFHKTAGVGNADFDVVMDRGFVKTTSITQIIKEEDVLTMRFENMLTSEVVTKSFNLLKGVNG